MTSPLTVKTPATSIPITLDEIKAQDVLPDDVSDDDALLMMYGRAATEEAEGFLNRALLTTVYEQRFDCFPGSRGAIVLERPPLVGVVKIDYTDAAGIVTLLDAADYQVDAFSTPGRIVPAYLQSWPTTQGVPNAVLIEYTAGYATPSDVPETIRVALLQTIAAWAENREAFREGRAIQELPDMGKRLMSSYRVAM